MAGSLHFPDGGQAPVLGLGTWHLGESRAARIQEVAAVAAALAMGYRAIDTAEMYGSGGAEEVVGQARGLIRRWGVSNFDRDAMQALWAAPGGPACAANQVYYSLSERGIEFDLLPWQAERGVPTMAYCPVGQGALATHPGLQALARPLGCSAAQLALAWVLRQPQVMPIPKAGSPDHLRENLAATSLVLDPATLAALDGLFPPPRRRQPLAMT